MKRFFTKAIAMMVLTLAASVAMAQTYTYPVKGQQGFSLTEKTRDGIRISYELGSFTMNQLNYRGEEMSEISIKGIILPNNEGSPNLPTESRLMAIPQGSTASLDVVRAKRQVIKNVNIAPALRIQAEDEEPDMEYKKDMKVYSKNAFYPENPFMVSKSYIRGVDAVTVSVTPFQYNPVTKELAVYTDIELSLNFEGGNGHFGEDRLRSPYWDPILAAELMNYDQLPVIDYEARMQQWLRDGADGAEYLIITPNNDAWAPYAQQLKEYRMQQGIITEVYRLDEMPATTTNMMKDWFHNAYDTWEIAPVAVCLMGDHGTNMGQYIPAETVSHPSYGSCISDNQYADAQGNDLLPDMVFSRLIAETPEQLPVFVNKQIDYETNPVMETSFYETPVTALGWQTERWFQLCSEVFGGYMRSHGYNPNRINCIYDGTPGSSWSSNQNTAMVTSYFGPSGLGYIPASPSELGGWNGGSPEQVVTAVNNGTFWVQHRDHGLETGWGEPAVRNSHVYQMNNVGQLPFVMSINCLTGKFNLNEECFCEAWMRRTYNGENAGAVGLLCPTEVSYSFVNDAYVWGVYDLFDGDFMPDYGPYQPAGARTGNWMPAFGNAAGKHFLAQSSWPYNSNSKDITYQMFTAHCDAFLRIYTQVPETMTVNHQEVQLAGLQTFQITAPEGTTIALTKGEGEDLEIVAVATGTGDVQNIAIPLLAPPTVLRLTVTGQNYIRYEANIEVVPANGPYIIIDNYTLANMATQLNFGANAGFNLVLKNVGNSQATAGTATLTSDSEYVTITNGTVSFGSLNSNATTALNNAFAFTVSNTVPDNTSIAFTATINSGNDTYESHITVKACAPSFKIGDMTITEISGNGNGRLDPGETVQLSFAVQNKGRAASNVANGALSFDPSNVFMQIIGSANPTVSSISPEETVNFNFQILVGAAQAGFNAGYTFNVASGVYTDSKDFSSKIGLNVEDFEAGTLDPALWSNDATSPWQFVTESPYEGTKCLRSGAIGNNQSSAVTLTYQVSADDNIAFFYKVSSEASWDKLFFYIDGVEKTGGLSGSIPWTRAQYPVTSGTHTFMWKYSKDTSQTGGSDCVWIDFVELPMDVTTLSASAGLDVYSCNGEPTQILGFASNQETMTWITAGDGTFSSTTIADPIYTPGTNDIANGSVVLTMTATKGTQTITDETTVFITQPVTIENAINDITYCAVSEPQNIAVIINGTPTDFEWITLGDGVFADPNNMETTYTPGPQDIANGVTIKATATSQGCGTEEFVYPFDMNVTPSLDMPLPNCAIMVCQGQDFVVDFANLSGYVNGQMTMEINGETVVLTEGEPLVLPTANLNVGNQSFELRNMSNGTCDYDPDITIDVEVLEALSLNVSETSYDICEGENVNIDLTVVGGDPMEHSYTIEGDGIEPTSFTGTNYTLVLTPEETMEIHLTKLSASTSGCGNCEGDLDITIKLNVIPNDAAPAINGDLELDVQATPSTIYTITNGMSSIYSIEPTEAGTLQPAEDGMSVEVTWAEAFKGNVVLKATPVTDCNNPEGSIDITVKNSLGVNELEANTKLFPNPTTGRVNIECEGMIRASIFSAMGQMVYDEEVNTDQISIDLSKQPAGSYLVRIITNQGTVVKKLHVK